MLFEAVYFSGFNEMMVRYQADTQKDCLLGIFREAYKIEGFESEMTDEEVFEEWRLTETHDETFEQLKPCTEPIGNIAVIVELGRMIVASGFIRRIDK